MATADAFFQVSFGSLRLYAALVSTDNSRAIVVHDLSSGDVHPTQDRGLRTRRTRCQLLFDDFPAERDSGIRRFRAFKAAVDAGDERIFTHPIDGSFSAKVGEFTYDVDNDGVISNVVAEFIAASSVDTVSPTSAGVAGASGEGSVAAAADAFDAALADAGLPPTTVTADAKASQIAWNAGESVSSRQVLVDVARISDALSALIVDLEFETNLDLWLCFRTAMMFGDATRSAALASTSEVSSVFVLQVGKPISLLRLCAMIYGGAEAEDRQRQAQALNDIRRPAWLDAGTQLILPLKTVSPRVVF